MTSLTVLDNRLLFPSHQQALTEPNGLLAVGGDLSAERLKLAYQQGIFPWFSKDDPILWWSPDPRAVLYVNQLHVSRSMRKFIKQTSYYVTLNYRFIDVIAECAKNRHKGTWITPDIQHAYLQLHQQGLAHSVEVWDGSRLIGGLYGVCQGALFCGESMFSRKDNASKLALIRFNHYFHSIGGRLFDCQILNPHTASLGAITLCRNDYLQELHVAQQCQLPDTAFVPKII